MRIPVVNEQDEILGYKERENLEPEDICRVTSLWVTDKEGNILLAQRAFKKKTNPGMWGPAVSGTVEEGETYEENMKKEAQEEIGFVGFNSVLGPKFRRSTSHEYFVQWYTAVIDHNYSFKKQDDEVEEIRWFTKEEILKFVEENPKSVSDNFINTLNYFTKNETKN